MTPITLTTAQLKAMLSHVGKSDIRPHINCLMFHSVPTRSGTALFIIATDGHRMAIARYPAADWPRFQTIVHRDDVEALLRDARNQGSKSLELTAEAGAVRAQLAGWEKVHPLPSAKWRPVDWMTAVPAKVEPGVGRLDAKYVAEAAGLLAKFDTSRYPAIVAGRSGSCSVFLVAPADTETHHEGPSTKPEKVVVLVMAHRGDDDADVSGLLT